MVWTYASFDPLAEILEPGYFTGVTRFRVGDLVYVGTAPRPADSPWTRLPTGREIRRALVMIKGRDERGRVLVRLVQDFGGPNDADAPLGGSGPNDENASIGGSGPNDGDGSMAGCVPANGGDAPMVGDARMVENASPAPAKRGRGRPRKGSAGGMRP